MPRQHAEDLARRSSPRRRGSLRRSALCRHREIMRESLTSFPTSRRRRKSRRRRRSRRRREPAADETGRPARPAELARDVEPLTHAAALRRPGARPCEAPTSMMNTMTSTSKHQDEQQDRVRARPAPAACAARCLQFLGVAGQHPDDVVDAARDAAGEIVGPEARHDRVLDDAARDRVGQRAFEAIADLDAHLALVRRTISSTPLFLPCWPICQWRPSSIAVVLDRGALQRFQRRPRRSGRWSWLRGRRASAVSAARVAASRMPASSTTRPVSAGKSARNADTRKRRTA